MNFLPLIFSEDGFFLRTLSIPGFSLRASKDPGLSSENGTAMLEKNENFAVKMIPTIITIIII